MDPGTTSASESASATDNQSTVLKKHVSNLLTVITESSYEDNNDENRGILNDKLFSTTLFTCFEFSNGRNFVTQNKYF